MPIRQFVLLLLCAAPLPAVAQGFVADAFGLEPVGSVPPERSRWSDHVTPLGGAAPEEQPRLVGPAETILFFLGPKSLVAGKDRGHAVAIALDAAGNLVRSATPAEFTLGDLQESAPVRDGIADHLFLPNPAAGQFHAGVTLGARQGARAEFRVTADLASVSPELSHGAPARLMPESFAELRTGPLRDRFGNEVEDGVAVGFTIDHANGGETRLVGVTIDGRAEARVLTRDIAGAGLARSVLGSNMSGALGVEIERLNAPAPPEARAVRLPGAGLLRVSVGPFLTSAGHLLNDGAPVTVEARTASGEMATGSGWVLDGYFRADLPLVAEPGEITLTVQSATGTATLTLGTEQGNDGGIMRVIE